MKLKQYLYLFFVLIVGFYSNLSEAQNLTPFAPRYDKDVQGDILLIGNNILNRRTDTSGNPVNPNTPYNSNGQNSSFEMGYIDIDSDATTFSSSSATLDIPTISDGCYQIDYVGLYWSAILQQDNRTGINNVKVKLPGDTNYRDLTGTIVHDMPGSPIGTNQSKAYVCYYDLTNLVKSLANPQGVYTVANVLSSQGSNGGTGLSAGWSMFIVYKDPNLVSKSIVAYDGFSGISGATTLDVPISGFRTIPSGPVRAKFAFSALEGDQNITGDYLRINGTTISTLERPLNNFFQSSFTDIAGFMNNAAQRNPNSSNTLGYDAGIITNFNPSNSVLANNATSATIRLGSTQDLYMYFFNAFAVDIIEPKIVLTKIVQDAVGNNIGNANVRLCQDLQYVIGYQNTGNDDATSVVITDILPKNITFNPATDLILPPGVTYVYTAGTRTLVFTIPNTQVNVGDPRQEIRIKVKVVCTCEDLDEACSNIIKNDATATYSGTYNTNAFTQGSLSSFSNCNLGTPSSTNFLVGLDDCDFTHTVEICGNNSITLTAAAGYDSYLWSGPGIVGANNVRTITVNQPGTYTVNDTTTNALCKSIVETFIVTPFTAGGLTNPVIPYADQVVTCPNSNDPILNKLPLIFLCGANDAQLIQTSIAGAVSINWEQLNTASCTAVTNPNCPNENPACTWTNVGSGPNYNANIAGQFRVVIKFPNGCDRTFYFNVFKNVLDPQYVATDVICNTKGTITVTNVSAGYEYQIVPGSGLWTTNNVFTNLSAGTYTINIRQSGVVNGCLFSLPNIPIRQRNFTVTYTLTQPICGGGRGTINIAANDVRPQYIFTILQGATVVATSGSITANNYIFSNLNGGSYTYEVRTDDGCLGTGTFTIATIPVLTATAALTKPLSCTDGEITVSAVGGTPGYNYLITPPAPATPYTQGSPIITVSAPGTYGIRVIDSNNCYVDTSITVQQVQPPVFTISATNILCSTSGNTGTITVNVSNPNGNAIRYSIDNGVTWQTSNTFTNLPAGTYQVVVEYTTGTAVCKTTPQSVTITIPNPIVGTATLTTPYTCTTTGVITFSGVSGGTPGYTYSIGGPFQPGNVFSGLTNGTYTPVIKDAAGCTLTLTPIVIAPLNPPTNITFAATALSCPANTSNVTLTVTGGTGTITYQIVLPTLGIPQPTNVFNGLAPGTYTFEVTDANNCKYRKSYTIDPLPPVTIIATVTNNVRCFNTATGALRFTVGGFGASYNYTVTGPLNFSGTNISTPTISLTSLPVGTYTIVATNTTTNCSVTTTVTITQPSAALTTSITSTPVTCLVNGTVTVTATGGWGGYTYSISPSTGVVQSGNTFSNLSAGTTYTITTTDSGGCSVTNTITPVAPPVLNASISSTSNFCYTSTGATLVVTASGGTPGYVYSINNGPFGPSNTFGSLVPGTYTIKVRDSFGCEVTLPVQTINAQLTLSTVLTKDLDCTASPNAVITGTVSGGYPTYSCEVRKLPGAFAPLVPAMSGSTFTYTTPAPAATANGTYEFRITDSKGCTVITSVVIDPLVPVNATHTKVDNKCFGDTAGSVTISPSGGVGPYQINFNGAGFSSQTTYSNLACGPYNYIVRDSKSCTFNGTVTINCPAQIVYNAVVNPITCNISSNTYNLGSICVQSLTGGVAPYTYTLTNLSAGGTLTHIDAMGANYCFPNIDFGIYDLAVTDANGCTIVKNNLIMSSPPSGLNFTFNTVASCSLGASMTVTISGGIIGSGAYQFGIVDLTAFPWSSNFVAANPGPATHVFNGLTPGVVYTIVVRDMTTGCYYFQTAPAAATNSTILTTPTPKNVTCRGAADGRVTGTITGFGAGCTSISYQVNYASSGLPVPGVGMSGTLTPPPFNYNIGPLGVGSYTIYFKELNGANAGCGKTFGPFTISQSAVDLSFTTTQTNANCNSGGQIAVSPLGGTGPYLYQYLTSPSVQPLASAPGWTATNPFTGPVNVGGTYDVYVKDANDCIKKLTVSYGVDPIPSITATLANACVAQGAYAINVTINNFATGIPPFTYSLDSPTFTNVSSATFTLSGLNSGSHTIVVKDKNGCTDTKTVNIFAPLSGSAVFSTPPTCRNADGKITVTATGGSGTYSYSITPNTGITLAANVFSNVAPNSYTVRITDTVTNCFIDVPVSITVPQDPDFNLSSIAPTCSSSATTSTSDASITVNLVGSNSDPVYMYEITSPIVRAPQTSNIFTGLSATVAGTTYTIRVTSGKECSTTKTITINAPSPVVANASIPTPAFVCNGSNVLGQTTITITGSGGTPAYTYSIDGTNYYPTNTFQISALATAQNITCYVKDANGCIGTFVQPIPAYVPLSATFAATPLNCTSNAVYTITASGGSGSYSYSVIPPGTLSVTQGVGAAANQFTISAPGAYQFRVTDNVTNCYYNMPLYTIDKFNFIDVVATATKPVICFGGNDGAISVNVTGYTGLYTYQVFDVTSGLAVTPVLPGNTATNPLIISGLLAGNYKVTIIETATPFCTKDSNVVTIEGPAADLILDARITAPLTCDPNTAVITATAVGGWSSSYTYTISPPATQSSPGVFTGLGPANYTITVTDAKGCKKNAIIPIVAPNPIDFTLTPATQTVPCFNDKGTISFNYPSGGQGSNYGYILHSSNPLPNGSNSGPFTPIPVGTTTVINDLPEGDYKVIVSDGYNCTATRTAEIKQPSRVVASLATSGPSTCTLTAANLQLTASGGTPPYTFSSNLGGPYSAATFNPSVIIPVTGSGINAYYVKDANGCVSFISNEVKIDDVTPLSIASISTQNVLCGGDQSGTIRATAIGGLSNYVYQLLNAGGTLIVPQPAQPTPGYFTGLSGSTTGITYIVRVISNGICVAEAPAVIKENPALIVTGVGKALLCNSDHSGKIIITVSGGTGNFQYAISPNMSQFFDIPRNTTDPTTFTISNLDAGIYKVLVQDAAGCKLFADDPTDTLINEIEVKEPKPITFDIPTATIISPQCAGGKGSVIINNIAGGVPPYKVVCSLGTTVVQTNQLTGSSNSTIFGNLDPGNYIITVYDAVTNVDGQGNVISDICKAQKDFEIVDGDKFTPQVVVTYPCINNKPSVRVEVFDNVNGTLVPYPNPNTTGYTFSLDSFASQPASVFTTVPAGNHIITVKSPKGCTIPATPNPFTVNNVSPMNVILQKTGLNKLTAVVTGGIPDYHYTFDDPNDPYPPFDNGNDPVFIYDHTATYIVVVTDSSGCTATNSIQAVFTGICVPNVFTPNADGNNDEWAPGCIENYPKIVTIIYDRYGREVARLNRDQKWDGKYNGSDLPSGDYWYVIRVDEKNADELVGHFTLYR